MPLLLLSQTQSKLWVTPTTTSVAETMIKVRNERVTVIIVPLYSLFPAICTRVFYSWFFDGIVEHASFISYAKRVVIV